MDTSLLLARLLMGVPFIYWGFGKLRGGDRKIAPMLAQLGLPDTMALAFMVGLCEFAGGVMIVLGWPLRTAAVLLGLWCILTGYLEYRANMMELMKNITMGGGYFALAVAGSGTLALFGGAAPGILGWLP